jgi:hypothetical protein
MTVYTGLLVEAITVEPDAADCLCTAQPGDFPNGVVCGTGGLPMRWLPGDVVARFDQFTPPYVRAVCRG